MACALAFLIGAAVALVAIQPEDVDLSFAELAWCHGFGAEEFVVFELVEGHGLLADAATDLV